MSADLLKILKPDLDILVVSDYNIPKPKDGELIVLSSYSGNTEEVLSVYDQAKEFKRAVITTGGKNILCIQNDEDNHGSFLETNDLINSISQNIRIISMSRADHAYPYIEEFSEFLSGVTPMA